MLIKFSNFFTRGNTIEYQYNCQNKLIKGIYPNDAAGNILNKETKNLQNDDEYLGLQLYAYNRNNEISSAFDGTYLYDENGNLIKDCYGTAYTYDCYNRVATVTKSDGTAISYTYSAENVRTSKTLGNHTTRYCYDTNGNILMEKTDGTVDRIYVWGSDILGMMMPTSGGYELYGYFQNAHGDVTGLYQGDYCYAEYDYDAYGNVVSCSETGISNPIRYASYYYDTDTQNYYLMNRYYSPYQGRFLTLDPYWNVSNMLYGKFTGTVQKRVYYPAVVQSGNRFAYCGNNPVMFVDPWGLVVTAWDRAHLTPYEQGLLEAYTSAWNEAYANGDEEGMKEASDNAEALRFKYRTDDEITLDNGVTITKDTCVEMFWNFDDPDLIKPTITFAYGGIKYDLGQGWSVTYGAEVSNMGSQVTQKHIHVLYKGKSMYSQNIDGSPHDNSGTPPNAIKKALKKVAGWDWDAKTQEYEQRNNNNNSNSSNDNENPNTQNENSDNTNSITTEPDDSVITPHIYPIPILPPVTVPPITFPFSFPIPIFV